MLWASAQVKKRKTFFVFIPSRDVRFSLFSFVSLCRAPVPCLLRLSPAKGRPGKPVWLFKVTRAAPQLAAATALAAGADLVQPHRVCFVPPPLFFLLICFLGGFHSLYFVDSFTFLPTVFIFCSLCVSSLW